MSSDQLYVLAENIEFIPVLSVPDKHQKKFEHTEGDVVLTHMHTRKASKVIAAEASVLLKQFEKPLSMAEAIFNFATENNKDPQQLAEDAFDFLSDLRQQGFLKEYDGPADDISALIANESNFGKYTLKKKLQEYEDSEVFCAEDASGNKYVLKLFKQASDEQILQRMKNEAEILGQLDGISNIKLIEADFETKIPWLVTEWFDGIHCDAEAANYRNFHFRDNLVKALDLCIGVVKAYAHLHKQKIFHTDIHPGNILIANDGKVKMVDFGLSGRMDDNLHTKRGGVVFYSEPEYAVTAPDRKMQRVTETAEQYCIAAVIYKMLTGHYHIDFSNEKDKLTMQLAVDPPTPVKNFDLNLPEEMDPFFSTALHKDPAKRFASMQEFEMALAGIRNNIFYSPGYFVLPKENIEEKFIQFFINKFGWGSGLQERGFSVSPTCSVNYGAAGIAYMFYRMSCIREEPQLLDLADLWANRAGDFHSAYEKSFYDPAIQISEEMVGKRALYHSPTGVYLMQALIGIGKGDLYSVNIAVDKFLLAATVPCNKIDAALGKCSLLIACAILLRELQTTDNFNTERLRKFANDMLQEIWQEVDTQDAILRPNAINYFGIAHGWAGILYATLLWCHESSGALPKNFENRMMQLLDCAIQKNNIICWPLTLTYKSPWTGWCNGSAGHIFLWSLLYKHFGDEKFLHVAEQLANHVIGDTRSRIISLCCGMAGQAYSLLNLHRLTGEKKFYDEASMLKQRTANNLSLPADRINSLYKSLPGAALLFCEFEKPQFARMPLFE